MMKPACPGGKGVKTFAQKGICYYTTTQPRGTQVQPRPRQNHLLFTNLQFVNDKCPGKSNLSALVGNKWHFLAGLLCGVQAPVK
jgi:hypothetical protein